MSLDEQGDTTAVTGSSSRSHGGLPRGHVVGERYEVQDRLREDAFTRDYRALDQETESPVLLRVVRQDLLDAEGRAATVKRLQETIGVGGRYLPGILDAERDGAHLFVVEPMPSGVSLAEILEARRTESKPMKSDEVLPILARVAAALAAIPPPWRHGDIRPENVWVLPDGFSLGGAFLLPAMPEAVVRQVLSENAVLRPWHAPEVLRGSGSDASDRFASAVLALTCLLGELPARPTVATHDLAELGDAIRELLAPDPAQRARTLDPLLGALASRAALPIPDLEAGSFRRPRRLAITRPSGPPPPVTPTPLDAEKTAPEAAPADVFSADSTEKLPAVTVDDDGAAGDDSDTLADGDTQVRAHPRPSREREPAPTAPQGIARREIAGAAPEGTQEISADAILSESPADAFLEGPTIKMDESAEASGAPLAPETPAPPKKAPADSPDDLDPRLVRAALGITSEDTGVRAPRPARATPVPKVPAKVTAPKEPPPDLDPRLVRAALAPAPAARPASPKVDPPAKEKPRRPRQATIEITADELELLEAEAMADVPTTVEPAKPRVVIGGAAAEQSDEDAAVPDGVKGIPKPRASSQPPDAPRQPGEVLFDDSQRSPSMGTPRAAAVVASARASAPGAAPAPMAEPVRRRGGDPTPALVHTPRNPSVAPPRSGAIGRWIVLVAVLIAGLIILAGVLLHYWRKSQMEEERERRLQERFQQIQQLQGAPPPSGPPAP